MVTFSNTRKTRSYPSSSVIHLPASEYIFNIYSPFGYNYRFLLDDKNTTQSYVQKRRIGR